MPDEVPMQHRFPGAVERFFPFVYLRLLILDEFAWCGEFIVTLTDARGREIGRMTIPAATDGSFLEPTLGEIAELFGDDVVAGPAFLIVQSAHVLQ